MVPDALLEETAAWRQAGTYEAVLEAMDLSTKQLHERAVSYCDAALRLAANVIDEYETTYSVHDRAVADLAAYCRRLEALRAQLTFGQAPPFDRWSHYLRGFGRIGSTAGSSDAECVTDHHATNSNAAQC